MKRFIEGENRGQSVLFPERLDDNPVRAIDVFVDELCRWEHEAAVDAAQRRLDQNPWVSKIRRQTAEHPFGTLKAWMGSTHFLTRTLPRVSTEMSLHVLAYNMKRLLQIFGTRPLLQMLRT